MNEEKGILNYFLGANSTDGFYSLYDGFISQNSGNFLWIIKGGRGCGKSSFMRKIGSAAENAGLSVEYAYCSGDPDSLDGIFIPELKTAYMDGTAPHVADANIAALDSGYVDLGSFYDITRISTFRNELIELNSRIGDSYKKAYSLLSAAGSLKRGWKSKFVTPCDLEATKKRINAMINREFGIRRDKEGKVTKRFLSAITCKGIKTCPETAGKLCSRFYSFENTVGMGYAALMRIFECTVASGASVMLCPDPLTPELPEAVLCPDMSLGFVLAGTPLSDGISVNRRFRLDSLYGKERFREVRSEVRHCDRLISEMTREGISALSEAKVSHDAMEGIYNPNVDFAGVYALAQAHIKKLGLA